MRSGMDQCIEASAKKRLRGQGWHLWVNIVIVDFVVMQAIICKSIDFLDGSHHLYLGLRSKSAFFAPADNMMYNQFKNKTKIW